jgi:ABC-2 type transport system ATP-binding protein
LVSSDEDQEVIVNDTTDAPAIVVEGLRKVYPGGSVAVKGLDLRVAAGEVFGLLGPNGAGKSTTIGMLTSTVAPTSGTARLGGFDVATEALSARRISSVLFQDPVVDKPLSGRRNLEIHARLWGVAPQDSVPRVEDIIEAFDLAGLIDRPVGTYSGGERRRLEIARALVSEPQVLFLDEPTVGLDPRIRHELLDVIGRLRERDGMTILLTTHYLDEAERLSDRIAIMRAGEIVALGTPTDLVATLGSELVELRVPRDAQTALESMRAGGIAGADAFAVGSTLIVPAGRNDPRRMIADVHDAGIASISIISRRPTLDDVYLQLTGDQPAEAA